jgi:hypothetical protein
MSTSSSLADDGVNDGYPTDRATTEPFPGACADVSHASLPTLADMDLRIGVTHSPRELTIELADDTDRDELRSKIDAALTGAVDVFWVTDKKQRDVGVSAAKIAYVEIGTSDADRRIGFGG